MITRHFKKLLFKMALVILPIMSAQGVTITYDLNGGELSNGANSYQADSNNNNNAVLDNPTKTGYIFTGWCDTNDYTAATNTCSNRVGLVTTNNKTMVRWTVPNDLSTDTTFIAMWEEDKFQATTTNLSASDSFSFSIGAAGTFWIDWGDGNVEYINKNDTTDTTCSHTYTTNGVQTIHLGGLATGYPTDNSSPRSTIAFWNYTNTGRNNPKLAGISGSLGAIFPTLSNNTANLSNGALNAVQPRFYYTFTDCMNLTGSIPANLFTGIFGKPASQMFDDTFAGCSNLGRDAVEDDPSTTDIVENAPKYSIPSGLFSNLSGAPTVNLFKNTFNGCSGLTGSIPATLFSGISGTPAQSMFAGTFEGCSGLTGSIPATLFSGISGTPAQSMFAGTFGNCSSLTGEIPGTLFNGISGTPVAPSIYADPNHNGIFEGTFAGCSNLGRDAVEDDPSTTDIVENAPKYSIPANLFSGISGAPAGFMFKNTFSGCSGLTGSIPANLFSGISGAPAQNMFASTFSGCSGLTGTGIPDPNSPGMYYAIPPTLFSGISGAPAGFMFNGTFYNCSGLTGSIPANLFSGISGDPAAYMFSFTFDNCSGLTGSIPPTLFSGIDSDPSKAASSQMYDLFYETNLLYTCPTDATQYITGFESYFDNKVSCIANNKIVCPANQSLPTASTTCVSCSGANCETYATLHTCPDGYLADATHESCITGYTITYYGLEGTNFASDNPNQNAYTVQTPTFTLNNPTKAGYEFAGWCVYDSADNIGVNCENPQMSVSITNGSTGDIWAYATWTAIVYYLNYYETGTHTHPTTYTVATPTFTVTEQIKSGYEFLGWCVYDNWSTNNGTNCENPQQTFTIEQGSTGNRYIYAVYSSPITYNITYDLDNGIVENSNPVTYDVTTPTFTLNNPTKSGLEFLGWCVYDSANNTGANCANPNPNVTITTGSTGNKWIYAHYAVGYNITYDLDGGTATNNPSIYTAETPSFTLNSPDKEGYAFAGWCVYDSANNSGANCANPNPNVTIATGSTGDKWIYAKFVAQSYAFEMTTTNLSDGDTFEFRIAAKGKFWVDCGTDGTLSGNYVISGANTILQTSADETYYTCTYATGGVKTIRLGGMATEYNTYQYNRTLSIYNSSTKLAGISGSLGTIFPTIGRAAATVGLASDSEALGRIQPNFDSLFWNCTNLTGTIPPTLFSGIEGQPRNSMFDGVFGGCSGLTGTIPATLFSGISGSASGLFTYTFMNCSNLTGQIPDTLFSGISSSTSDTFYDTFAGCSNLGKDNGTQTYYISPTLMDRRSDIENAFSDENSSAGFVQSCPNDKVVYYQFNNWSGGGVSCITPNSLVCPAGQSLDLDSNGNYVCTNCSGANCPTTRTVQTCPSGYTNNADFSACIQPYTISYELNGGTFFSAAEYPVQYIVATDNVLYYRTNTNDNWIYSYSGMYYGVYPRKLGYKLVGWCKGTDDCPNPESSDVYISNEDTGNKTFYAQWEWSCPSTGMPEESGIYALDPAWFDLDGNNGGQNINECISMMYTMDDSSAAETCMYKALCNAAPAMAANMNVPCAQLESVTCDYATAGLSYATCRYNAQTYESAGFYTDCSTVVNVCNDADMLALLPAMGGQTDSAGLFPVELVKKGYNQTGSNVSNWNTYFGQSVLTLIPLVQNGMSFGDAWDTLNTYNTCSGGSSAFTCESNTWLHVGNEQICTYATKTTDRALAIRVDANHVYYVMLTPASENDYPIHAGSNYKLKIREYNAAGTSSTIYNAHDMSVVSE